MRTPFINLFNIIRKQKLNTPSFEIINGNKVIKSLNAIDRASRPVNLKTRFCSGDIKVPHFTTEIRLKHSETPIAYNTFMISEEEKLFNGENMQVNKHLRRAFGYGELLRLASIIGMKENKLDKLSIFASSEAVPFHHKYKFYSDIPFQKDFIEELLMKISRQRNPKLAEAKYFAKNLMCKFETAGFCVSSGAVNKLLDEVNSLVENYLKTVDKNNLKWESSIGESGVSFRTDIDMMLDWDTIVKNRDFFNEKFAHHGIDYSV